MTHLKFMEFYCSCVLIAKEPYIWLAYAPYIWFWSIIFDFIHKLHKIYYKKLWCNWYATRVQCPFNITKFQLGFNYLNKFENCVRYVRACDMWLWLLINLGIYINGYHALVLMSKNSKKWTQKKRMFAFILILLVFCEVV